MKSCQDAKGMLNQRMVGLICKNAIEVNYIHTVYAPFSRPVVIKFVGIFFELLYNCMKMNNK
jgi:hypothetical protein